MSFIFLGEGDITIIYPSVFYPISGSTAQPYPTLPYPTLPYPALPYPTLFYSTLPHNIIPRYTVQ